MRFLRHGLGLCLALAAAGCSTGGGASSTGSAPPPNGDQAEISFDHAGNFALEPRAVEALRVITEPPAPYAIRFTLIGDAGDGWLTGANVEASADGRATVELTAPSHPATFRVRASILGSDGAPGASAEVGVAVSDQGFGTIRVVPFYQGKRPIDGWVASLVARTTCADIMQFLPGEPDGSLIAMADGADGTPMILSAPVGPNLAVAVRAGHYAFGCTNTTALEPGDTLDVKISVSDRPLDLSAASLHAQLAFTPDPVAYGDLLYAAVDRLGDGLVPPGASQASVLLNEMQALVPPADAAAFVKARVDQGWDTWAAKHLGLLAVDLRAEAQLWAAAGLATLNTSLEAYISPGDAPPETSFAVTRFYGLDPLEVGASPSQGFTWHATVDDSVTLSGIIAWEPSRLAGVAARAGAKSLVPGVSSVPEALAQLVDCDGLGAAMGAFGACSTSCVALLCTSALGERWKEALGASKNAGELGELSISASSHASVGDAAEPIALDGQWQGKLKLSGVLVPVTGDISAVAQTPPPP